MIHHIDKSGEPPVVIKPTLLVTPQPRQRRGAIFVGWRAFSLERVDANLVWRVQIVAGLSEQRGHVAVRATCGAVEERPAAFECGLVE